MEFKIENQVSNPCTPPLRRWMHPENQFFGYCGNLRMYVKFKLRLQASYSNYADVLCIILKGIVIGTTFVWNIFLKFIILTRNSQKADLGGVHGFLTCFPILNCIRECYEQLCQVSDRYLEMQDLTPEPPYYRALVPFPFFSVCLSHFCFFLISDTHQKDGYGYNFFY